MWPAWSIATLLACWSRCSCGTCFPNNFRHTDTSSTTWWWNACGTTWMTAGKTLIALMFSATVVTTAITSAATASLVSRCESWWSLHRLFTLMRTELPPPLFDRAHSVWESCASVQVCVCVCVCLCVCVFVRTFYHSWYVIPYMILISIRRY